jgi:hypothetical protein
MHATSASRLYHEVLQQQDRPTKDPAETEHRQVLKPDTA